MIRVIWNKTLYYMISFSGIYKFYFGGQSFYLGNLYYFLILWPIILTTSAPKWTRWISSNQWSMACLIHHNLLYCIISHVLHTMWVTKALIVGFMTNNMLFSINRVCLGHFLISKFLASWAEKLILELLQKFFIFINMFLIKVQHEIRG